MDEIIVRLKPIEIPWILRSLEHTLETLQQEARSKGEDAEFVGPIPVYKQLIQTFTALQFERTSDAANRDQAFKSSA